MTDIAEEDLSILPLIDSSQVETFDSTNDDLNDFLRNDALKSQYDLLTRTFLCFYKGRLAGFLTLVTDTIEVKLVDEDDGVDGYPYQKYPAIKIARLAVDKRFERQGIGRFLLLAAVGKVYQISKDVGCRYITLDSKRDSMGFYEKFGFKAIGKYLNRRYPPMYLNMYPIVLSMRLSEPGNDKN